jgi:hypothetical protein
VFREEGSDSAKVLARSNKARGSVRFTPAAGKGRARRIVATVEQSGAPRDTLRVARYTAPAWRRPAKPRGLRVRRTGTNLLVSWKRAAGAARYMVFATSADGDRQVFMVPASRRSLRIAGVRRNHRAVVEVTGQRADNVAGSKARVTLKPGRKRAG